MLAGHNYITEAGVMGVEIGGVNIDLLVGVAMEVLSATQIQVMFIFIMCNCLPGVLVSAWLIATLLA